MKDSVALRSKIYCYLMDDGHFDKRAKDSRDA